MTRPRYPTPEQLAQFKPTDEQKQMQMRLIAQSERQPMTTETEIEHWQIKQEYDHVSCRYYYYPLKRKVSWLFGWVNFNPIYVGNDRYLRFESIDQAMYYIAQMNEGKPTIFYKMTQTNS